MPGEANEQNPSQDGNTAVTFGSIVPPQGAPVNGSVAPQVETPTETPAPAPAPSPEAPKPGEQPKVEAVPSEKDEAGLVVYDETGDAGLDLALAFIGRLGIEGTDPAMVAAANGDFSFIEAKLSTLGDEAKGWEKHVQLAKDAHGRQLSKFTAEQEATNKAVHAIAGGEDKWKVIVEWAGKEADPAEKAAINAMFDAGGFQARAAAQMLVTAYSTAKGTTVTPANPASQASGVAAQPQARLTQADYHKEVSALHQKLGNSMDGSPEYADLKRRFFGR